MSNKLLLPYSNPNNLVSGKQKDVFYRRGEKYYLYSGSTVTQLSISKKALLRNDPTYKNVSWALQLSEDEIGFATYEESWAKNSSGTGKTGWAFISNKSPTIAAPKPTPTPTKTPKPTSTKTPTPTPSKTPTPTPTKTPTPTPTPTQTSSPTPSSTPSPTSTVGPTNTPAPTAAITPTPTKTPTQTPAPTPTSTPAYQDGVGTGIVFVTYQ